MVPSDFIPECNQMFITIQALPEIPAKKHEKKGGKKNNNVLKVSAIYNYNICILMRVIFLLYGRACLK